MSATLATIQIAAINWIGKRQRDEKLMEGKLMIVSCRLVGGVCDCSTLWGCCYDVADRLLRKEELEMTPHDAKEENWDRESKICKRKLAYGFDVARYIVDTYLSKRDAKIALKFIEESERRCCAEDQRST